MRSITVQLGTRTGETDDVTPVLVSITDDGEAHPEWTETASRIAGDRAVALFRAICEEDAPAEGDPPTL